MKRYQECILQLVKSLPEKESVLYWRSNAAVWLVVTIVVCTALLLWVQPLRPSLLEEWSQPRFFLEVSSGFLIFIISGLIVVLLGFPDSSESLLLRILSPLLIGMWVALVALGLVVPALEPSMVGKRPFCFYEGIVYGIIGFLIFSILSTRLVHLRPRWNSFCAAITAGFLPCVLMHLGCMYDPRHILKQHCTPLLIVGGVAFLIGPLIFFSPRARWNKRNNY